MLINVNNFYLHQELESEGDIMVIYNKEVPRFIYPNDKSLNVEMDDGKYF